MILNSPSAIIYINPDLTAQVLGVFVRQLYIDQVLSAAEFDAFIAADPNYPIEIHQDGKRILILRNLHDQTNRNLADIVLFAKGGLVSVLSSRVGPPGITLPINRVYITALINLQKPQRETEKVPDLDDDFIGEIDNDDFDGTHLDPQVNNEPPDEQTNGEPVELDFDSGPFGENND